MLHFFAKLPSATLQFFATFTMGVCNNERKFSICKNRCKIKWNLILYKAKIRYENIVLLALEIFYINRFFKFTLIFTKWSRVQWPSDWSEWLTEKKHQKIELLIIIVILQWIFLPQNNNDSGAKLFCKVQNYPWLLFEKVYWKKNAISPLIL